MSFEKYLAPLQEELIIKNQGKNTLGASISAYTEIIPYWEAADMAFIGIQDYRGDNQDITENEESLQNIREVLYSYKKPINTSYIIDLGNLISGDTIEETTDRIKLITSTLLSCNTLPIFFGGTQATDIGIYQAFQELEKQVSFLYIDKKFDLSNSKKNPLNQKHLNPILLSSPNYLESFYQLGHQAYLVEEEELKAFDKLNFETMRLGEVRSNIEYSEPLFRSAEVCSFDAGAIKRSELPAAMNAHSFGFTGEEACQMTWYAGMSETTKVFNLSEFDKVEEKQSAEVLATMLWYFVEGFYHRKETLAFDSDKYICFTVSLTDYDETVNFYKSTMTNRWWFKSAEKYIPCNYKDYLETAQGEIPNRIFKKVIQ
jgi:formiminoglutamase